MNLSRKEAVVATTLLRLSGSYSLLGLREETGMSEREQAGVLSSLARKGVVKSDADEHSRVCGKWVDLTEEGVAVAERQNRLPGDAAAARPL